MKKVILLIVLFCPIILLAETFDDKSANITFNVDNEWTLDGYNDDARQWKNDECGLLRYTSKDFYDADDNLKNISRNKLNSNYLSEDIISSYAENFNILLDSKKHNTFVNKNNVKFGYLNGIPNDSFLEQVKFDFEMFDSYYTINNGYYIAFIYMGNDDEKCINSIRDIVDNVNYYDKLLNVKRNLVVYLLHILKYIVFALLAGIIIKYDKKKRKLKNAS